MGEVEDYEVTILAPPYSDLSLTKTVSTATPAVATVIVLIVTIGVVVASYMIARAERKRTQEIAAAHRA